MVRFPKSATYQIKLRRCRYPAKGTDLSVQVSIGHKLLHQFVDFRVKDLDFSVGAAHCEKSEVWGKCGMAQRRHVAAFSVGNHEFFSARRPSGVETDFGGVQKCPARWQTPLHPFGWEIRKSLALLDHVQCEVWLIDDNRIVGDFPITTASSDR